MALSTPTRNSAGDWIASGFRTTSGTGGVGTGSASSSMDKYFKQLQQITAQNNAWSAQQAQNQMAFQAGQGMIARKFNHDEAELSRLWQERMSNTAHQREIKDLQAAGLNPVLSAMGGSGAPVTSGATASGYSTPSGAKGDTDTSLAPALVSLLGTAMQTQASIANTAMSARTSQDIAELGFKGDIFKALTSQASAREVANINAGATLASAKVHAGATITSANINALASQTVAQLHYRGVVDSAMINRDTAIITKAMDQSLKKYEIKSTQDFQREQNQLNRDFNRELENLGFDHKMLLQHDANSHEWKMIVLDDVLEGLFGLGRTAIMSGALSGDSSNKVPIGFLAGLG